MKRRLRQAGIAYLTIAIVVAADSARTPTESLLFPARNESMIKPKEAKSRVDTISHHQCSKRAIRNQNVHML
jgi:hypothetical protein